MVGTLERTTCEPATAHAPPPPPPPRFTRVRRGTAWLNTLAPVVAFALLIIVWKLAVVIGGYQPFILPPPETVARAFWDALREGILWPHMRTTLVEAGYG